MAYRTWGVRMGIEKCGLDKDTAAQGDIYKDGDEKRQYVSWGNNKKKSELQKTPAFATGKLTMTGGDGDITITVPFDWTDGWLRIITSNEEVDYFEEEGHALHETTYDALTNATYTDTNILTFRSSNTAAYAYIKSYPKIHNSPSLPNAATATTFTLNDNGTTQYVKWFIWA